MNGHFIVKYELFKYVPFSKKFMICYSDNFVFLFRWNRPIFWEFCFLSFVSWVPAHFSWFELPGIYWIVTVSTVQPLKSSQSSQGKTQLHYVKETLNSAFGNWPTSHKGGLKICCIPYCFLSNAIVPVTFVLQDQECIVCFNESITNTFGYIIHILRPLF